ncbi:hepcidin [Acomys russatus]|uniref:hepcidin n=1 Tax=Acomys russatus TaxID=60746 RepID=UPI0021E1DAB2|nr:hepcidin [Acomys russatus]
MALSTQTQAACLLLLLLASLCSSTLLQQQMNQPAALQPWHRAESRVYRTLLTQSRRKRDSNISVCLFCCKCCNTGSCGFCCKT